jgi:vacuolar-type H+-ATPase subunit H
VEAGMADIIYLVERLEQVLAQGWRVPFTTNAVIDEDAFIDIVEQMHIAIPVEIRQAQQVVQQKDRILAQAREEAERILEQARAEAAQRIEQTDIVARARSRGDEIIAESEADAEDIRTGADEYATEVLSRIKDELTAYLRQVENGLNRLQPPPPLPVAPSSSTPVTFDDGADDELEFDLTDEEDTGVVNSEKK